MLDSYPYDVPQRADWLGARYSRLTHEVFFGANMIVTGVYGHPLTALDSRTSAFTAVARTVWDAAAELDTLGAELNRLDGPGVLSFWRCLHADTVDRLANNWEPTAYRLRWGGVSIPKKARRELERDYMSERFGQMYQTDVEADDHIGERYADLTYWAVLALRTLTASETFPDRRRDDDEPSLKHEIVNAKSLIHTVHVHGDRIAGMPVEDLDEVVIRFDAQTRRRTRCFANDLRGRLRPMMVHQDDPARRSPQ